jgi:hypothetical protein
MMGITLETVDNNIVKEWQEGKNNFKIDEFYK